MAKLKILMDAPTDIQRVFINSRCNGATYYGDYLPQHKRVWPRGTFLQRRLAELKKQNVKLTESEK